MSYEDYVDSVNNRGKNNLKIKMIAEKIQEWNFLDDRDVHEAIRCLKASEITKDNLHTLDYDYTLVVNYLETYHKYFLSKKSNHEISIFLGVIMFFTISCIAGYSIGGIIYDHSFYEKAYKKGFNDGGEYNDKTKKHWSSYNKGFSDCESNFKNLMYKREESNDNNR